ncbi:MAG: bifunctional adenosylcobinamide kinase/adenosylcobinamide-phosphate guanylyltransferase [Fluviibacter sp.]
MRELILGGARSGKSRLAEKRAVVCEALGMEVVYIATAEAWDPEMVERLTHHRNCRPAHWVTVEEPVKLAATLQAQAAADRCLIVDCITLWLSALVFKGQAGAQMEAGQPIDCTLFEQERQSLLDVLPGLSGEIILVSNEIGSGIVPENRLARRFADEQGRFNQELAARCERVTLSVAGIPVTLRG